MHGWVYSLADGRVRQMGIDVSAPEQLAGRYQDALAQIPRSGRRD